MDDYYDALKSAVANLKNPDRVARYAFYDRARKMVIERLRAGDQPMPDVDLRAQVREFDAAVRRIETEIRQPQPAQPHPQPEPQPRPAQRPPQQRPPQPQAAPQAARPPQSQAAPQPQRPPPQQQPTVPQPRPAPAAEAQHPAPPQSRPVPDAPRAATQVPPAVSHTPPEQAADAQPEPDVQNDSVQFESDPNASEQVVLAEERRQLPGKLALFTGAAAVLALAAIAFIFFSLDDSSPPVRTGPVTASPPPQPVRKPGETVASATDNLPFSLRRQLVFYRTVQAPGTIVIAKSQNFLYVVRENNSAMRYTFAMGSDCDLNGLHPVSRKDGEAAASGPDTRALYLADTKCRIRLIDTSGQVGQATRSSGIQLAREDFAELFDRTPLNARVVITN